MEVHLDLSCLGGVCVPLSLFSLFLIVQIEKGLQVLGIQHELVLIPLTKLLFPGLFEGSHDG